MNAQGVFYQMPYGPEGLTFTSPARVPSPSGSRSCRRCRSRCSNLPTTRTNSKHRADGERQDRRPESRLRGGYLVRNIEQQQDYTNYSRGVFGYYYQCAGYSKTSTAAGKCYSPAAAWQETEKNTHQSHEFRVSTPDDWRIAASAASIGKNSRSTTTPTGPTRRFRPARRPSTPTASTMYSPGPGPRTTRTSATTTSDSSTMRRAPSSKGGVRFDRRRHHSEDFDIHGRHPLLQIRRKRTRRRRGQLLLQGVRADHLLRALHLGDQWERKPGGLTGARQFGQRSVRHQSQCGELPTTRSITASEAART
jgi:hypothetical protein